MENNNETRKDIFVSKISRSSAKLANITEYVENHLNADPDNITYADIGDIENVLSKLKDIERFLGI